MAKAGKKKGRKGGLKLDFEGVESGSRAVADGTYAAAIDSAEEDESSEGNPMLKLTHKLKNGAKLFDNVSLLPQALWRLKTLLECIGEEVPDGEYELDPADLIGKELMIEVTNEKWQGKDRPKVTGYGTIEDEGEEEESDDEEEEEDDEEEEEKPSKKSKGKKGKSKKDDDDEEDEEEDEDEEEEEEDEEEEKPAKKGKKGKEEKKSKSKFKTGQKVTFKDEDGKKVKGVITEIDGDSIKVEDKDGDEWEVEEDDLTAA